MRRKGDLAQLQRRFTQQTTILRRQKENYESKLHEQINRSLAQAEQHSRQLARLRESLSTAEQRINQLTINDPLQDITSLHRQKELLLRNAQLQQQLEDSCDVVQGLQQQKSLLQITLNERNKQNEEIEKERNQQQKEMNKLQIENTQLQRQLETMGAQFEVIQNALSEVNNFRETMKRECEQFAAEATSARNRQSELQQQLRVRKEEQKKKRREWENKFSEVEQRMIRCVEENRVMEVQMQRNTVQYSQMQGECLRLRTRAEFNEVALHQKEEMLKNVEEQFRIGVGAIQTSKLDLERRLQESQSVRVELLLKVEECNIIIDRLKREKQGKNKKVLEQDGTVKEELGRTVKEELERDKLQQGDEYTNQQRRMKMSRSQGGLPLVGQGLFNKIHRDYEQTKSRGECQTSELKSQIVQLKAQINELSLQLRQNGLQLGEKQYELQQVKEVMSRKDKQHEQEEKKLKEEKQYLKNVQLKHSEYTKKKEEIQHTLTIKLGFQQSKIKELVERLKQKQSSIEQLQMKNRQIQERSVAAQLSYAKLHEEVEGGRRAKQELKRKDELMKELRSKIEKSKIELEELKQIKNKLEKELEGREATIHGMRGREIAVQGQRGREEQLLKEREEQQQRDQEKIAQLQTKTRKAKVVQEQWRQKMEGVRANVMKKVKECIETTATQRRDYEGCKLLGLEASQMEEFVNPLVGKNKTIVTELDILWEGQHFGEFIAAFLDYLRLQ